MSSVVKSQQEDRACKNIEVTGQFFLVFNWSFTLTKPLSSYSFVICTWQGHMHNSLDHPTGRQSSDAHRCWTAPHHRCHERFMFKLLLQYILVFSPHTPCSGWPGDASSSESLNQVVTKVDGESSWSFLLHKFPAVVPECLLCEITICRAGCTKMRSLGREGETWAGSHLGSLSV